MSTLTSYPHIEQRPDGILWLRGTETRVIELARDRRAHHWDADEIQRQHPHLTLGQIHSCLAYYYDHQEEMDRFLEEEQLALAQVHLDSEAKPLSEKEWEQNLMRSGLLASRMSQQSGSVSRRDFHPIQIEGEPLSDTVIRERR